MQTSARPPQSQGFSLVELMVALAVAGIIGAIAYPAYTSQIQRSRRADAIAALTAVMQAQERYRSNVSTYASSLSDLKLDISQITPYYEVNLEGVVPSAGGSPTYEIGYVATATPVSASKQSGDSKCKSFIVTLRGATPKYTATGDPNGADTTSDCWPK